MKTVFKMMAVALVAAILLIPSALRAQVTVPGVPLVPLGDCQLSATQLGAAIGLASCTRASFTATAVTPTTRLVVTSVTPDFTNCSMMPSSSFSELTDTSENL